MNDNNLYNIAVTLSKPPKGILAADESTNTITKRFDSINLDSSFDMHSDNSYAAEYHMK